MPLDGSMRFSVDLPQGFAFTAFEADQHALPARELLNRAHKQDGGDILSLEDWWLALTEDSEFEEDLCFVIEDSKGEMAAFAHCWSSGFVKDIAVHEPHRHKGLARAMLHQIFNLFSGRERPHIDLKVLKTNPAVRFYERIGMLTVEF